MKEKLVKNEVLPIDDDAEDVLFTWKPEGPKRTSRNKTLLTSAFAVFLFLSCTLAVIGYQRNYFEGIKFRFGPQHQQQQHNQQQEQNEIKKSCPIQQFGYLMMVFRWAPSVCRESRCIPDYPESWVIHGLWPNYWNGSWPQNCCPSDKFNVKKIKTLETEMLKVWPNLLPGKTADSLWSHEWGKHGTCSSSVKQLVGEFNYFNSTLGYYTSWPVQKWLEGAGITPDNNTVVTEAKFTDAIGKHIPNNVLIHCENVKGSSNLYIDSISVCIDKTTLAPIDCPGNKDTCKAGLIYPQS